MQNKAVNQFEASRSREKLAKISKRSNGASGDSGGTDECEQINENEISIKSYF
jgi:hypothetical protein